jgi:hypothetical protein
VRVNVPATPRLRQELARLARGQAIVIDYYASARCGVVIGDITAGFVDDQPPESHVRLADLDGVPVFAEPRLVPLLEQTGPVLDRRLPSGDWLAVTLQEPEKWLDFLELPGIVRRRSWLARPGR